MFLCVGVCFCGALVWWLEVSPWGRFGVLAIACCGNVLVFVVLFTPLVAVYWFPSGVCRDKFLGHFCVVRFCVLG